MENRTANETEQSEKQNVNKQEFVNVREVEDAVLEGVSLDKPLSPKYHFSPTLI